MIKPFRDLIIFHLFCKGSIPGGRSLPLAEELTIPTPLSSDVRLKERDVFWIGVLEIRGDGIWKPVCPTYWSSLDSKAACRSMGFSDVMQDDSIETKRIILDDVRCNGDEDDIFDCSHLPLFQHNCRHYEDAGVTCDPGSGKLCWTPISYFANVSL